MKLRSTHTLYLVGLVVVGVFGYYLGSLNGRAYVRNGTLTWLTFVAEHLRNGESQKALKLAERGLEIQTLLEQVDGTLVNLRWDNPWENYKGRRQAFSTVNTYLASYADAEVSREGRAYVTAVSK